MKKLITLAMIIIVALYLSPALFAMEHPGTSVSEHPGKAVEKKAATHEHPGEHPGEPAEVTAAKVKEGIMTYLNKDIELKGGYFLIYDTQDRLVRQLKFVRLHEDKLNYVKADNSYFACSDFVSADGGTKVDVDFWLEHHKDTDKCEVTKITIHKLNGKPRYTYVDDKIVPVAK